MSPIAVLYNAIEMPWANWIGLDAAAPCDPKLQTAFAEAIEAHGVPLRHLPSGAGHDAMEFPAVAPMAMLFVRCGNNGISHHPDETMTAEDAELATSVLLHFFEHYQPPK